MIATYSHEVYEYKGFFLHFVMLKSEIEIGVSVFSNSKEVEKYLEKERTYYEVLAYDHMLQIPASIITGYLKSNVVFSKIKNKQVYAR